MLVILLISLLIVGVGLLVFFIMKKNDINHQIDKISHTPGPRPKILEKLKESLDSLNPIIRTLVLLMGVLLIILIIIVILVALKII